eukprot:TRINITY_DN2823_c6_g1_i1.p1 TRINITY_DN2823_c6_g1~~TRINITY_DN2823_c6_g1_i1.p1  ORF type:complete len:277 (+),score=50.48 TRINITY_DN2823_c6_g1_i1:56-832(+)
MLLRTFCIMAAALGSAEAVDRVVVVAGDSWADYQNIPNVQFPKVFEENGDNRIISNIAVGGSLCVDWAGRYLPALQQAVSRAEVEIVWMTCGGNDATYQLQTCAAAGTPSNVCVGQIMEKLKADLQTIYNAVHMANPTARMVVFGYDVMGFGSDPCNVLPQMLLPDCAGDAFCVNTQFAQIQTVVNELAATNANFDTVNLLGSFQAAGNIPNTAVGQPDLKQYSPVTSYDSTCIHPTQTAYHTIFTNFYTKYFEATKP